MGQFPGEDKRALEAIREILRYLGEDETREGLRDTPQRVLRSWGEIYGGLHADVTKLFKTFEEGEAVGDNQIVLLKDIEFYSTCEHHLLPFTGMAHVAYMPDGKIIGISKLARVLEVYARRAQIQERIGNQVTRCIMDHLNPLGAACIIEAKHFCMVCRGVQKQHSLMVTSSLRGCFLTNAQTRAELMDLIRK